MSDNTEKCIICGYKHLEKKCAEFVPFLKDRMFHFNDNIHTELISCPNCNVTYSSYRPTDEEMSNLYTGYRDSEYQKCRQKYEPEYTAEFNYNLGFNENSKFIRHYIMEDCIKPYIKPDKIQYVLDYSGDSGQYIPPILASANRFVYDISNVQTEENIKSIKDFIELKDYNWDLIMCCHVLEHVSSPMNILNQIKSLSKTNGYIYIEVPYEDYYKNNYASVPVHEHINFFSKETFNKIFSSPEYLILANHYVNIPSVDGQVFSKHLQVLVKKVNNESLVNIHTSIKNNLLLEINDAYNNINDKLIDILEKQTSLIDKYEINNEQLRTQLKTVLEKQTSLIDNNKQLKDKLTFIENRLNKPTFLQTIFSVRNEGAHKVWRIFGIKIKCRRKIK